MEGLRLRLRCRSLTLGPGLVRWRGEGGIGLGSSGGSSITRDRQGVRVGAPADGIGGCWVGTAMLGVMPVGYMDLVGVVKGSFVAKVTRAGKCG